MVSWVGDGLISGYNFVTKKLDPSAIHLVDSPVPVDANGITRIGWSLDESHNATTYPNRLSAKVTMTYTSADFTAAFPYCAPVLFLAPASAFGEGVIPSKRDIYVKRTHTDTPDWVIASAQTRTFNFSGWGPGSLGFNTKYWALVLPLRAKTAADFWAYKWQDPTNTTTIPIYGRSVSFWTDRTPKAPTITSPPSGSVFNPREAIPLTFTSNDPDKGVPDDAERWNDDLAGVVIEYAPLPTPANPNPAWQYLRVQSSIYNKAADQAVAVRGIREGDTLTPLITNRGVVIRAASDSETPSATAGEAWLPAGDWQIRVATLDFGTPYPNLPAFGVKVGTPFFGFPPNNLSPYSDPVIVSVPSQVPPPIPLSPADNLAVVEGKNIPLVWRYRNTAVPTYKQSHRTVQIREVGAADWSTIFSGFSEDNYVTLPPVLDNSTVPPPVSIFPNGGFETNTTDGWIGLPGESNEYGVPPLSHAGVRHLDSTGLVDFIDPSYMTSGLLGSTGLFDDFETATFKFWARTSPDLEKVTGVLNWAAGGSAIGDTDPVMIGVAEVTRPVGGWPSTWVEIVLRTNEAVPRSEISRPASADTLEVALIGYFSLSSTGTFKIDDVEAYGQGVPLDSFSLETSKHYEWRVKVADADNEVSNWSEPARFWVVPEGDSGGDKPVPADTIDGATLGCGTHRVFVYRRGGLERVAEITDISYLDWGRVRDDISTAKITVSDWSIDCGNLLASLQTWAYEIVIFRDNGFSVDRVWEGPITLLTYKNDSVVIQARDVMAYAYRRIIRQKISNAGRGNGTTVTSRAGLVLRNAFAPDDPNVLRYLRVIANEDDAMQYRSTPAFSRTAFEEVDDMAANAGLDYTTVGRSIMVWGTKRRIGTLPEFRDADLGNAPIVSEYGMSMANVYSVSDGSGVYGVATAPGSGVTTEGGVVSGNDPVYGLVEMLSSTWASDSADQSGSYSEAARASTIASFEGHAQQSIGDRYPPPVVVRVPDNTTLNPDAVVSIQHLVPGVAIPLRSSGTLRTVVADQKLDSVRVIEQDGVETISVTMSPFRSNDNDAGGEGGGEE